MASLSTFPRKIKLVFDDGENEIVGAAAIRNWSSVIDEYFANFIDASEVEVYHIHGFPRKQYKSAWVITLVPGSLIAKEITDKLLEFYHVLGVKAGKELCCSVLKEFVVENTPTIDPDVDEGAYAPYHRKQLEGDNAVVMAIDIGVRFALEPVEKAGVAFLQFHVPQSAHSARLCTGRVGTTAVQKLQPLFIKYARDLCKYDLSREVMESSGFPKYFVERSDMIHQFEKVADSIKLSGLGDVLATVTTEEGDTLYGSMTCNKGESYTVDAKDVSVAGQEYDLFDVHLKENKRWYISLKSHPGNGLDVQPIDLFVSSVAFNTVSPSPPLGGGWWQVLDSCPEQFQSCHPSLMN